MGRRGGNYSDMASDMSGCVLKKQRIKQVRSVSLESSHDGQRVAEKEQEFKETVGQVSENRRREQQSSKENQAG